MDSTAFIDEHGNLTLGGTTCPVPWWSFTKTVLSIAALRLVDNGAASLDEPQPGARFTLRQLLRHEAGLPDYGDLPAYHADVAAGENPWPVQRLLEASDANRLLYEPGCGWAYSNIGTLKVAQLIERASDKTLTTALSQLVFGPGGLKTARLATQLKDLAGVEMGGATAYHPGWVYHGLVVGTVADAATLLHRLAAGHLLRAETFAEMLQPRPLPQYANATVPDPGYGLGLMLWANHPADHPLGHGGEGPGSRIAVYAKSQRAAALWTSNPSALDLQAQAFRLLA